MFHLNSHRPNASWNTDGRRVYTFEPNGLGDLQVAECANEEIARTVARLFSGAPKSLREAVFESPTVAAVELMEVLERPVVIEGADPWTHGEPGWPTEAGKLRAHLREWAALDHTDPSASFAAVRAFAQSALDAADALDAARAK